MDKIIKIKYMKKIGIIYKITNKINKKVYIGQTRSYENNKEKGTEKRWKRHVYDAGRRTGAPYFGNAIRKYGKENFTRETILYCPLKRLNEHEINYIYIYDSTNSKYGYNLSKGGGGASLPATEEKRKNISIGQGKEIMGILEKYRNGKLVGYRAQRKQNGQKYEKLFTKTSISLEENKRLAEEYLKNVKNNNLNHYNSFNRKETLPQNISKEFDNKGRLIGYRFQIIKNKKTYVRVFSSNKLDIDKMYLLAVKEKEKFIDMENKFNNEKISKKNYDKYLKQLSKNRNADHKSHNLPRNIKVEYVNKKIAGYRFQIRINKKLYCKVFKHSELSMEEKLKLAINAKNEFMKNNNIFEQ